MKSQTILLIAAVMSLGFAIVVMAEMTPHRREVAPPLPPPERHGDHGIAASGLIESENENVRVGVPSPGLVQRVHVKVGDTVSVGDPLFDIDARELEATLLSQRADADVAQSNLSKVADQWSRIAAVADPRAVSEEERKTKQFEWANAQAAAAAALARVQSTRLLIRRLQVCAPRAASVLQVTIRAGEYVSTASPVPAMVLGDTRHLQVRADIAEEDVARFTPGTSAYGYLRGDAQRPLELQFVRVDPFVIPKQSLSGAADERVDTRVLQVIYRIENNQKSLYVGTQMDVYLRDDAKPI